MDGMWKQVGHLAPDPLVSRRGAETRRTLRHDQQGKVPAAACRARVADVLRSVVMYLEDDRGERSQALARSGVL